MNFKEKVKDLLLTEENNQKNQQQQEGQQILLILKYFVDNNPNATNEEILKMAEEKLGPIKNEGREKILQVIQQLKETKKIPQSAYKQAAKKPGFFKRIILGVLSPILSVVGVGASIAGFFVPQAAPIATTLRSITGIVYPVNMAIGVGAQLSNLKAQRKAN